MKIPPEQYYQSLPRKYMSAGALFLNEKNEALLVKPNYKEFWEIPGGMVNENESPQAACVREVKEELDLECDPNLLLIMDFSKKNGIKGDSLQFVFFGGLLTNKQIDSIELQKDELNEFGFFDINNLPVLNEKMKIRLPQAFRSLTEGKTIFYENKANISR